MLLIYHISLFNTDVWRAGIGFWWFFNIIFPRKASLVPVSFNKANRLLTIVPSAHRINVAKRNLLLVCLFGFTFIFSWSRLYLILPPVWTCSWLAGKSCWVNVLGALVLRVGAAAAWAWELPSALSEVKGNLHSYPGRWGWFALSLWDLTEITQGQESSSLGILGYSDISYPFILVGFTWDPSDLSLIRRIFNSGVVQVPREAWRLWSILRACWLGDWWEKCTAVHETKIPLQR